MLKELLESDMKKRGMSIREYAIKVGVSHSTIFRALRGDIVDVETAKSLAKYLNVKPSQLLNSLDQSEDALPEKFAMMVEHYPTLTSAFEQIIKSIENGEVSPAVIDDIAAYALFRLSLAKNEQK